MVFFGDFSDIVKHFTSVLVSPVFLPVLHVNLIHSNRLLRTTKHHGTDSSECRGEEELAKCATITTPQQSVDLCKKEENKKKQSSWPDEASLINVLRCTVIIQATSKLNCCGDDAAGWLSKWITINNDQYFGSQVAALTKHRDDETLKIVDWDLNETEREKTYLIMIGASSPLALNFRRVQFNEHATREGLKNDRIGLSGPPTLLPHGHRSTELFMIPFLNHKKRILFVRSKIVLFTRAFRYTRHPLCVYSSSLNSS